MFRAELEKVVQEQRDLRAAGKPITVQPSVLNKVEEEYDKGTFSTTLLDAFYPSKKVGQSMVVKVDFTDVSTAVRALSRKRVFLEGRMAALYTCAFANSIASDITIQNAEEFAEIMFPYNQSTSGDASDADASAKKEDPDDPEAAEDPPAAGLNKSHRRMGRTVAATRRAMRRCKM